MANFCCPTSLDNLLREDCKLQRGGLINEVYVVSLCDIDDITSSTNDKLYDAIVMNIDPVTTNPFYWYRIQFKKETASASSTFVVDENKYFNQAVSLQHSGITLASLTVLESFATADLVFIAKDSQGKIHLLGRVQGLEMTEGSISTGAAASDAYGSTLTFTGNEPETHNFIAPGTVIQVWDGTAPVNVTL